MYDARGTLEASLEAPVVVVAGAREVAETARMAASREAMMVV